MRNLVFLIFATISICGYSQQHQYIKIYTVQAGTEDKDKAKFVFPSQPDSAWVYNAMKLTDILLGVELMEKKGYELVTINTATASLNIVTVAIMRRRLSKPKQ